MPDERTAMNPAELWLRALGDLKELASRGKVGAKAEKMLDLFDGTRPQQRGGTKIIYVLSRRGDRNGDWRRAFDANNWDTATGWNGDGVLLVIR